MLQLKNFRLQIYDIEYPFVKSLILKDFYSSFLQELIMKIMKDLCPLRKLFIQSYRM